MVLAVRVRLAAAANWAVANKVAASKAANKAVVVDSSTCLPQHFRKCLK